MDERNESEKMEEVMLPGFRFHPTDEELVGFYLKRKIQQRPLSIEVIKQLDIYKYDPWDLPKLATLGEKEWYFYCPRDRKYRNSARPNRVTGAGFWKATGTDRPIYNSEGSKCIGLKKSLVFYKGRAAKGTKTDWMMHEFRLPSTIDSASSKRYIDKNVPANDAWAICRIFKKTNSTTQRTLSHSWVSPPSGTTSDMLAQHAQNASHLSSSGNISLPTNTNHHFDSTMMSLDLPCYKSINHQLASEKPSQLNYSVTNSDLTTNYTFSSDQPSKCTINDASSLLLNMSSSIFGDTNGGLHEHYSSLLLNMPHQNMQGHVGHGEEHSALVKNPHMVNLEDHLGNIRSLGLPYGFPLSSLPDAWRSNLLWDSSPCPSEISTNYSTN